MQNSVLKDRAAMFRAARQFFYDRAVLEVDCPIITQKASVDAHIDLITTVDGQYLHSSPEYGMKRLLSKGVGDIYQLSHVFRSAEIGLKHNPEFMMAEWYREGITFQQMIDETIEFIKLFLGDLPIKQASYRDTFLKYTGIDIAQTDLKSLIVYCDNHNIPLYEGIKDEGLDAFFNLILGHTIEPQLGSQELFILSHYPASQAALARKTTIEGISVAERFEIYFNGVELANGYHELTDAKEQRQRLHEANRERIKLGKTQLPIDENFLKALESGLPDSCGVAVGFDRLMMLRHNTKDISDVIPFVWNQA
ncbi:MAG: EF-P lysine aminoacylase EpmA [Chlamydiota bacterium]|nr:EF-P lysine aminoacylase EpmA [Chlamydiota bacterium]